VVILQGKSIKLCTNQAVRCLYEGRFISAILVMRELLKNDKSLRNIALFLDAVFEQSMVFLSRQESPIIILVEADKYCDCFLCDKYFNGTNIVELRDLAIIIPRLKYLSEKCGFCDDVYDAEERAKYVTELLPQDAGAWYSYAWILCQKKEFKSAEDAIEKAWACCDGKNQLLAGRICLCFSQIEQSLDRFELATTFYFTALEKYEGIFLNRIAVDLAELEELKNQLGI
jgi:tetratricopeptide (TPR) repeat protein